MTKPWGPAYEILVNADAEGGSIEAKLVTPYGETIPDFIRADSVPLTSNGNRPEVDLEERPVSLQSERGTVRRRLPQAIPHSSQGLLLHLYTSRPGRQSGPSPGQRPLAGRDHPPLRSLRPRLQRAGEGRRSPPSATPVQPRRRPERLREADAGIDPQQEMKNSYLHSASNNSTSMEGGQESPPSCPLPVFSKFRVRTMFPKIGSFNVCSSASPDTLFPTFSPWL